MILVLYHILIEIITRSWFIMKKLWFIFSLMLVLIAFTGCALVQTLDRAEDHAEAFVEGQEDKAEQLLESVVETMQVSTSMEAVTKEQAEDIALEYAGFSREQVSGLRTEYEIDDGISQYSVEFRGDGWEFEFEIHEKTGKILSFDKDRLEE